MTMLLFIASKTFGFVSRVKYNTAKINTNNYLQSKNTKLFSTNEKKYIIVTGGVISGIGKGITASSIGVVLKMLGFKPTAMKIDPYLNVDAGTMSPFEHGETFVLDDGAECDLDLGNYERFLDVKLTHDSSLTTGKVYQTVIAKERKGDYLGKTVQIIPHITDEIMNRIVTVSHQSVSVSTSSPPPSSSTSNHNNNDNSNNNKQDQDEPDICIVELGGTIGDIESMPFVEAIRQLQLKVSPKNLCLVHVSMVPTVGETNEQKTKPTQHSVKEMRSLGLSPDFIVCRSKEQLDYGSRTKISLFCNVLPSHVLSMYDLKNIYLAPLVMIQQDFHHLLVERLGLNINNNNHDNNSNNSNNNNNKLTALIEKNDFYKKWLDMTNRMTNISDESLVNICVIGKYTNQGDSYVSLVNAIKHSCIATNQKLNLIMIESTHLEKPDITDITATTTATTTSTTDDHSTNTVQQQTDLYNSAWEKLKSADGVIVPGGFGYRGVEGKINAIQYVREHKIPFLGVCLGMQVIIISVYIYEYYIYCDRSIIINIIIITI